MDKFLTSNETSYRLARTILQGIIGVLMANLDVIFTALHFTGSEKVMIVALTMAILSPIMGAISSNGEKIKAYDYETSDVREDIEAKSDSDSAADEEGGTENE
ncbi:hypothetical protein [Hornefia butyriciproducens]|uniref:hypothetical protein n=1 Tax=Hornefia butyriciproducens TaxID=2652293 RepID=UPI002A9105EE|nr:hypothetical protein [Hornefia butyriciproducens]MCI7413032.1 hypothetical protein [Clostridiales bacterium]MDY6212413.1 hypothetical protein [Hornefia butyriciproducens]